MRHLFLICAITFSPALAQWAPLTYDADAAPADNPLKGFVPFTGEYDFPHSMEFDYVGMDDLMDGPDSFTFDAVLVPLLEEVASRGHQMVLRVFIDYPDERFALPGFLLTGPNAVETFDYTSDGGGMSPDYENERLVSAMEALIAALGAEFDGDPRIGFIELGLLGHWGEWHTYPDDELFPGVAVQDRVLAAYDAAFDMTKLVVSQDVLGQDPLPTIAGRDIGFHDDDFANNSIYETGDEEDQFWQRIEANNLEDLWQSQPIAGEIQPDYQDVIWDIPSGAPEDVATAVQTTHAAWLINHLAFEDNTWDADKTARAVEAARKTGYEFYVAEVMLPEAAKGVSVEVGVLIESRGVAPFYYDWPIEVRFIGDGDELATTTDWRLTTILPDEAPHEFVATIDISSLSSDDYTVRLRVVNPLAGGKLLRFANVESQNDFGIRLGTVTIDGEGEGEGEGPACSASRVPQGSTPIGDVFLLFVAILAVARPTGRLRASVWNTCRGFL